MAERAGRGMLREGGLSLFALAGLFAGLSCGGGDIQAPTTGSIEITTATSGPEPDANGYAVSIDDQAETPIGTNATLEREGLEPGSHSVRVTGIAANCTIAGENPRAISVPAGETTLVTFQVTCSATTGSLEITASTTGASADPDGYTVSLDGTERGALATSGSVTVSGLTPGNHAAGLGGVPANCQVQGDNPRAVTVTAGASVTAAFAVVCDAPPAVTGSIRITVSTTGPEQDVNGYAVALDGGSSQPIGVNATTILANVGTGAHTLQLSGVAANCTIQGSNARSVTLSGGATAEVSFAVTCGASTGAIEITTTSAGGAPDPDGYTVAVDDGTAQPIGINATQTVPTVSPGAHRVTLGGLATNCRVEGDNPLPVVVTAGATAIATFSISCAASSTSQIAFLATRNHVEDDFDIDIYVMNGDGSAVQNLTRGSDARDECCYLYEAPSWSPDGKKILFLRTSSVRHFYGDVYVIDPDGANLTNLTRIADEGATGRTPAWSPDGRKIAYTNFVGDQDGSAIYSMDGDGMRQTRLTFGSSYQRDPDWSPDGTKIVYENGFKIELMNADGTGVTQLTHFGVDTLVTEPLWSPDGSKISFRMEIVVRGAHLVDLWVMNPDGSGAMKLTNHGADRVRRSMAAWSPDGSKIAVALGGLQVMNRDGTGSITLGVDGFYPAWSPDGTKLAFMGPRSNTFMSDIFIVNANGTGLTNLTNSPDVDELFPAWSP